MSSRGEFQVVHAALGLPAVPGRQGPLDRDGELRCIKGLLKNGSNRQGSYARFELLSILAAGVRKGDQTLRSLNPRELRTSR
jgi:hypothetical protein